MAKNIRKEIDEIKDLATKNSIILSTQANWLRIEKYDNLYKRYLLQEQSKKLVVYKTSALFFFVFFGLPFIAVIISAIIKL